jgi:hypothetical protein
LLHLAKPLAGWPVPLSIDFHQNQRVPIQSLDPNRCRSEARSFSEVSNRLYEFADEVSDIDRCAHLGLASHAVAGIGEAAQLMLEMTSMLRSKADAMESIPYAGPTIRLGTSSTKSPKSSKSKSSTAPAPHAGPTDPSASLSSIPWITEQRQKELLNEVSAYLEEVTDPKLIALTIKCFGQTESSKHLLLEDKRFARIVKKQVEKLASSNVQLQSSELGLLVNYVGSMGNDDHISFDDLQAFESLFAEISAAGLSADQSAALLKQITPTLSLLVSTNELSVTFHSDFEGGAFPVSSSHKSPRMFKSVSDLFAVASESKTFGTAAAEFIQKNSTMAAALLHSIEPERLSTASLASVTALLLPSGLITTDLEMRLLASLTTNTEATRLFLFDPAANDEVRRGRAEVLLDSARFGVSLSDGREIEELGSLAFGRAVQAEMALGTQSSREAVLRLTVSLVESVGRSILWLSDEGKGAAAYVLGLSTESAGFRDFIKLARTDSPLAPGDLPALSLSTQAFLRSINLRPKTVETFYGKVSDSPQGMDQLMLTMVSYLGQFTPEQLLADPDGEQTRFIGYLLGSVKKHFDAKAKSDEFMLTMALLTLVAGTGGGFVVSGGARIMLAGGVELSKNIAKKVASELVRNGSDLGSQQARERLIENMYTTLAFPELAVRFPDFADAALADATTKPFITKRNGLWEIHPPEPGKAHPVTGKLSTTNDLLAFQDRLRALSILPSGGGAHELINNFSKSIATEMDQTDMSRK